MRSRRQGVTGARRGIRAAALMGALAATAGTARASALDKLTFYTEPFPPFQIARDGELKGLHIALARAVFARADTKMTVADIRVAPWPRAYEIVRRTPNTVLFGTGRKPAREDSFIWIGPLTYGRNVVLARERVAASAADRIGGYMDELIATVRADASETRLLSLGVPEANLRRRATPRAVIRELLQTRRVDYWAYNARVARYLLRRHGLWGRFEPVLKIGEAGQYFAVHPETDPAAVKALRRAYAAVRESGQRARILKRHDYCMDAPKIPASDPVCR